MKLLSGCIALFAAALLVPGVVGAAPANTGTLTGTVTCGAAEDTPASHVIVDVAGTSLNVRTDGGGRFTLSTVPTAQVLTIDASMDPNGLVSASRFNVVVQPGETLDIGNLDLAACPAPSTGAAASDQDQSPMWDGGAD